VDKELVFLVAEDDSIDLELLMHSVDHSDLVVNVQVVCDGEEAIEYLLGKGKFAERQVFPFPHVVVVDLKMPRMDGLDVLRWIRRHPKFAGLPVIILSGSGLEKDVDAAYRLGANSYFTKPYELEKLQELVRLLIEYWSRSEGPAVS
jgi:CheY-like chemotaxis protein